MLTFPLGFGPMRSWWCALACAALTLSSHARAAGGALEIKSIGVMQLKVTGEFSLASPGNPARYRLNGPGKANITVAPAFQPGVETLRITVEFVSAGTVMKKETLTVELFPRLTAPGAPGGFTPFGFRRLSVRLPPKSASYEIRVSGKAAVSVSQPAPSKGNEALETPAKPEGKPATFTLDAGDRWQWGSVCDSVKVQVPEAGVIHIGARMQLQSMADLPPPSFMRVLSNTRVKAATPITAAPEVGLEFVNGRSRFPAGTLKKLEVAIPSKGEYIVELAAWGCVNGVGMEILFEPGAVAKAPSPVIEPPVGLSGSGTASAVGQKAAPASGPSQETLAQCNLLMEDATRQRVLEYLDTMVASGIIPGSRLAMQQDFQLGDSFTVDSIVYTLDESELLRKDNPKRGPDPLGDRELIPGPHTLEVLLILRGQGTKQFEHLNDYVFRVNRKESFIAEAGKKYDAKIAFKDRGGFTSALRDRPYIELDIQAREP
jgi:hypothetical protein